MQFLLTQVHRFCCFHPGLHICYKYVWHKHFRYSMMGKASVKMWLSKVEDTGIVNEQYSPNKSSFAILIIYDNYRVTYIYLSIKFCLSLEEPSTATSVHQLLSQSIGNVYGIFTILKMMIIFQLRDKPSLIPIH